MVFLAACMSATIVSMAVLCGLLVTEENGTVGRSVLTEAQQRSAEAQRAARVESKIHPGSGRALPI